MESEYKNSVKIGKGHPPKDKQFKKGHVANPTGRPKKIPALEELFKKYMTEEKDGIAAIDAVIMQLRSKATKGDFKSIEYLLNRIYGKPKESIDHNVDSKKDMIFITKFLEDDNASDSNTV
jgi:hypothetical protein